MADLKQTLIKLGSDRPDLQPHLEQIIDHLSRSKQARRTPREVEEFFDEIEDIQVVEDASVQDFRDEGGVLDGYSFIWVDPKVGGSATRTLKAEIRRMEEECPKIKIDRFVTPRENRPSDYRNMKKRDFYARHGYMLDWYYYENRGEDKEEEEDHSDMFKLGPHAD